LAYVLCQ